MWKINSFLCNGSKKLELSGITFTSLQAAQNTLEKIAAQEGVSFISYRVKYNIKNYLFWHSIRLFTEPSQARWVVYDNDFIPNKIDTPFLIKNNLEPYV